MKIITRRKGEGIVIADDIIVSVVEVRGDRVRLGIECPMEVPVHSGEVFQAIHRGAEEDERLE